MGIDLAPFLYLALAFEIFLGFVCLAVGCLVARLVIRKLRPDGSFQRDKEMRPSFEKPGFLSHQPGNV